MFLLSGKLFSQSLYFPPLTGSNWDTISPSTLGWCDEKVATLIDYVGSQQSKAFIVLKDGKIVLEKYYGTFTKDSLWYWASAGKTLTAFLTGIAQEEGYLSISDKTSNYLGSGWTNAPLAKEDLITVRHQLCMTTGLDDNVPDHYCTLDTCLNYLADAGTRWAYHNGPYTLLDGVITAATGTTLNTFNQQKVKVKTGMTGSFFQVGYNNVYLSTARSMARFALLIQGKGKWGNTVVMSDTSYFNQMINTSQNLNKSYGYLWWLNGKSEFMVPGLQTVIPGKMFSSAPDDVVAALGKNGQLINVSPSTGLAFIRMGNAPVSSEVPFFMNDSIWKYLSDMSCEVSVKDKSLDESVRVIALNSAKELRIESAFEIQRVLAYNNVGQLVMNREPGCKYCSIPTMGMYKGVYYVQILLENGEWVIRKVVFD